MTIRRGDKAPDFTSRHAQLSCLPCSHPKNFTAFSPKPKVPAIDFPVIPAGDGAVETSPDGAVANLYGMIHPNADDAFTVRSVVVDDSLQ